MNRQVDEFSKDFKIKVVRDIKEFKKLKEVWDEIAQKTGSFVPWLCWDWFNLFLKYFGKNKTLFVLLVYNSEEIIAIAPFMVINKKYKGLLNARIIQFMSNMHSPVCNFIFGESSNSSQRVIVERIIGFLFDEYKKWDIIELEMIPEENGYFEVFLNAILASHFKNKSYSCKGDWYLDEITYSFSDYFKNIPRRRRKDVGRCQRHLQDIGELRFHLINDTENLDQYLDLYSGVRKKSWKGQEKDNDFLRDFAKSAAEKGWLRLPFLFLNDVPIACEKWMVWNKTGYAWAGVYDVEFGKYSPGNVITSEITKHMIDKENVCEIDLGEGDEDYKKAWTPKRRERKGITIFNNNMKGQILAFLIIKILPLFQKQSHLISLKKRISDYLKARRGSDDNL